MGISEAMEEGTGPTTGREGVWQGTEGTARSTVTIDKKKGLTEEKQLIGSTFEKPFFCSFRSTEPTDKRKKFKNN